MPTDVIMPQMGESIFEGTITKWLKKAGDLVEKDEPLFEISTDKVDAEIPSPLAGILSEIKVGAGQTVQVNTVVAVIGGAGASAESDLTAAKPLEQPRTATLVESPAALPAVLTTVRPRSSPLVRRIAKENNLDLARIAGTGSGGRITKEDVLRHLAANGAGRQSQCRASALAASTSQTLLATPQVPSQPVAMTKMRSIIAERMVESMQIAPHVHTVYKVDMTRVVGIRERERAAFERKHGVKLTFMPFVAAAVVQALTRYPIVNASLLDGLIHYHPNINLGIAVALEWGLIVPVIKQAEARGFADVARTIADLADRARTKKLMPNEVGGSTFTLTNSGIFGDEFSTPIINQPESAILAISGLKKEPIVLTDADGNDAIAIRSMQHFCLGFDHRLIDGADACRFMLELKRALETWDKPVG